MKYWPHVKPVRIEPTRVWVPREMITPVFSVLMVCALMVGWGFGPLLFGGG